MKFKVSCNNCGKLFVACIYTKSRDAAVRMLAERKLCPACVRKEEYKKTASLIKLISNTIRMADLKGPESVVYNANELRIKIFNGLKKLQDLRFICTDTKKIIEIEIAIEQIEEVLTNVSSPRWYTDEGQSYLDKVQAYCKKVEAKLQ